MKYASDAGTEIHFKSSINQVIEAGASVTVKCGSNFININPAGVFIEGEMVMINSGGAAVSGTGSNPANAIAPMGVIEADDAKPGWEAKPPPPVVALELPDTEADDAIKNIDIDPSPIKRIRAPSGSIPGHWDVDCVKKIFCKNTPAIVTQLRKTTVKTADKIYYDDPYFNGKKWTTKRFEAGGSADSSSRQIMILSGTSCEDAATTLYHEIWHQNQSPSMDWPEPSEDDAYYNTEQWTIDQGLSGQSSGLRKKDPATGKLVPDKKAIRAFVQKEYPGPPPPISGKPQPVPIDADPAGNRTLVREPGKNGKTYWRPSKSGDTFAGPENRVNEKTIDPKQWKCP